MKVVALAGGVGGAKLADGLARVLPPENLTVIVNTGDDFEHYGLKISPDVDTVCYTLAELSNPITGWGRQNESWNMAEGLKKLGGITWFNLGDKDLATHLERTRRLMQGDPLSVIVADFCKAWNVKPRVLPMTDDKVATMVRTVDDGVLSFQEYFVKRLCEPQVLGFDFAGSENARPAPGVIEAILEADAVVVCPSNPMVSIGPILAVDGISKALQGKNCVWAVSPIINGKAVKGPAAKMYGELGVDPSALEVARQYQGWVHGILIDSIDQELQHSIEPLGLQVHCDDILMKNVEDRARLGSLVIDLCVQTIGRGR